MMRLDAEITRDLDEEEIQQLLNRFSEFISREKPDAIILEDYNKGVLTSEVIQAIISSCKKVNILTAVDPKRKNFFDYQGVDIFKPNLKEVKDALNLLFTDLSLPLLRDIHKQLCEKLHHRISFITLSERGVFYQEKEEAAIIPSHIRNIADVSGAGDTVIAVAAAVYALTKDIHLMAEIANIAGGIVCEEVGTVAVNCEKLLHECELLLV
jgi:D-glycero-beta-D-manno-heptose-7-phosphate kinase